ncbi:hypothetical protein SAMN04488067_10176 [Halorubrum xinjiangense]|uniref:DUF2062 domain-containing protein n=1 Tax=Halorubrum xinjiangense TaxID=261291 RepID=A0A1G7GUT5_9EURY|nr:DUF2062 domain-containing protein [Halorubrum xinjiangense]SDE91917.1 hypothetical protein SAMN04488067_10176 [Halorubrum xinjiangense]
MIRRRAEAAFGRAAAAVRRSFTEEHTSRETAGSFSVGVFITMLPTLGTGLLAFVALAWLSERVNRIAMFASVIVFNPAVKWGVYGASFALGTAILGPVPGATPATVSLAAGPGIVARLLVGNLILALAAAGASYVVCHRLVSAHAIRETSLAATVADAVPVTVDDGDASRDGDSSR